jgi:hypothetical protein
MPNHPDSDIAPGAVDVQALASLILDLNISRRNSRAYPEGHQVVDAALNKVLRTYAGLRRTGEELVIGVAGDALFLGDLPLEKSNLIYRDFARALHERGIGALVLHRGLEIGELRSFLAILGAKREDIHRQGGIEQVWADSGIASIEIRAIRYDLFTATEEARVGKLPPQAEPRGLWERIARGLAAGGLPAGRLDEGLLDPELLAEALNREFVRAEGGDPDDLGRFAESLLRCDIFQPAGAGHADLAYKQLADLVAKLTPGLRWQFLSTSFDIKRVSSEAGAEAFLRQLSAEVVIEALEDINSNQISVPPFILGLLQHLGSHASADRQHPAPEIPAPELHEKMRVLFREHAMEEYIPDSYQRKLQLMMSPEQIPRLGPEGVRDQMQSLDAECLESKTSDILLLLLCSGDPAEGDAALARNLCDICTFFLQTGNYVQLLKIVRQAADDRVPEPTRQAVRETFVSREFLEEVLDGLRVWGKVKFEEIGELIGEIGPACIESLLDRLADAESMSLRRFIMDRLMQFGPQAGPAIVERLSDDRWYFLRNLIGVVRLLELRSACERLRPLSRHRDPRVAQEALRALLQFGDPEAEALLLRDLASTNHEVQLSAVRFAAKSGSALLLGKLHAILAAPGYSGRETELKGAAVQSLAEIGAPASLAVLERVLASWNLLHPLALGRLKGEIVGTLDRYPASAARAVLERVARGRGGLARQAAAVLQCGPGRPS